MDASLIIKELQAKKFFPLYFLHGEESYYIDLITEAFQQHVLELVGYAIKPSGFV